MRSLLWVLALSWCAFAIYNLPFFPLQAMGWKLGLLFSLGGLVTVLLSTQHYFAVRYDIDEDTYEPPDRWIILFSLAITLLGAGVIYFVFTAPLNPLYSAVFE
jgi:putative membrane protein